MDLIIGSISSSVLSRKGEPTTRHKDDVLFNVKYPEKYDGKKYMPEGDVWVSRHSAEAFVKKGIGTIVEPKPTEEPKVETEPVITPKKKKK
jgi:hypothetical protein